jgi:hypothetical protein
MLEHEPDQQFARSIELRDQALAEATSGLSLQPSLVPFVYEPLDHEADSIRVLEVLPGSNSSLIQCRMRHTTIKETRYTCLSYTWQPSSPEREISVNGYSLVVGDNLYQFLSAFRTYQGQNSNRSLWIDAICMNQSDLTEKNHQVRQMGAIFQKAAEVLVWLGLLKDDMLLFLEGLDERHIQLFDLVPSEPDTESTIRGTGADAFRKRFGTMQERKWFLKLKSTEFCSLPYWNRVWIAQELLMPLDEEVYIFSGTNCYNFHMVGTQLDRINPRHEDGTRFLTVRYYDWRVDRHRIGSRAGASLPTILTHFAGGQCYDKRDRIFALLSLAKSVPHIEVDYALDSTALLQDVLEKFMDGNPLDVLLLFGATLIQALEIRQPPMDGTEHRYLSIHSKLQIHRTASKAIGSPVWSKAILELQDSSGQIGKDQDYVPCMFLGIFDAGNVHVFEYVVEENENEVTVRYARAHEYVRDRSRKEKNSSKVSYFCGPFVEHETVAAPLLSAWSIPAFKIVEDISLDQSLLAKSAVLQNPLLQAAKRRMSRRVSWGGSAAARLRSRYAISPGVPDSNMKRILDALQDPLGPKDERLDLSDGGDWLTRWLTRSSRK